MATLTLAELRERDQRVDTGTLMAILGPTTGQAVLRWTSGENGLMDGNRGPATPPAAAVVVEDEHDLIDADDYAPYIPGGRVRWVDPGAELDDTGSFTRTEIVTTDVTGAPVVRRYADRSKDTADMYYADGIHIRHRAKEPFYMAHLALLGNPGRSVRDRILVPVLRRITAPRHAPRASFRENLHAAKVRYRIIRYSLYLARKQPGTDAGLAAKRSTLVRVSKLLFAMTFASALFAMAAITAQLLTGHQPFLALWLGVLATLAFAIGGVACDLVAEGADKDWVTARLKAITAKYGDKRDLEDYPEDAGREFWTLSKHHTVDGPEPVRDAPQFRVPRRPTPSRILAQAGGGRHRAEPEARYTADELSGAPWH